MEILLINDNDNPVWRLSTFYNLKFFWSSLRDRAPPSNTYRSFWFPNNCHKMSLCLLRAAKGTLPTLDYLIKRTTQVNPTCPMCLMYLESTDHLFFKCDCTAYIWSVCRLKLGLTQKYDYVLASEMNDFQRIFTKKSGIRLLAWLVVSTTI